jgi:hypothetical protein
VVVVEEVVVTLVVVEAFPSPIITPTLLVVLLVSAEPSRH